MSIRVERRMKGLWTQSSSMVKGLTEHGTALQLKYVTPAAIKDARAALVKSNAEVEEAQKALRDLYITLRTTTAQARQFATLFRENMKPTFGRVYSTDWNPVGFYGSLEIPKRAEDVELLMEKLHGFYSGDANAEIAKQQLTAARAQVLRDLLRTTRTAIAAQRTELKNLVRTRRTKTLALRRTLMNLVSELDIRLDAKDPCWLSFGLRIPGMPRTPEKPTEVQVTLAGPTAVAVKWNRAPRAKYYRVAKRVVGVDAEFVPAGIPNDLDFTIEGLPADSTVEIAVAAANAGGVSGFSEVVTVRTPAAGGGS